MRRIFTAITLVLFSTVAFAKKKNTNDLAPAPNITSAILTSATNIQVTWSQNVQAVGSFTLYTSTGGEFTVSAATPVGIGSSPIVNLTVSGITGTAFSCANCLSAGAGAITGTSTTNGAQTSPVTDGISPTSSAGYTVSALKNGTSQTITLTFSEALTVTPKITVTGPAGTIVNNQSMSGGPTVWTYSAGTTWTGDGTATVTVGTGTDAAGNVVVATPTNNTFTVDNTGPTSSAGYTVTALKNGTSQTVTVTFSEAVTGTPAITVTGPAGTIVNNQSMSGGPTVWTYAAGSTWTGDGTATVSVGTATDAVGNPVASSPSNNTFTVDNTAPTSSAGYTVNALKNGTSQTITLTFSEALTVTPKITVTGPAGTIVNNQSMSGGPTVWTYAAGTTWTGDGTATVTVGTGTDAAGNVVASIPTNNTFTVDNTGPTSMAGYTVSTLKNGTSQTITLTFSEAVTGTPKITVTGPAGTIVNNQSMSGGPTVWTYAAGTTWTGDGTATVTVGTATDAVGNVVASSPTNNTFTVDNTGPTSSAGYTANSLKNGTSQTITVTFGEAVTGTPTITVTGPAGTIVNNQSMSGGPTIWTYAAGTTWTGDGTATVTVGTATDALGNVVVTNPTNNTFTVDNTSPTSSAGYTASSLKNGTSQTITLTFSEALTVTPAITVTGPAGTIVNNQSMSGGPTVWTYAAGTAWTGDGTATVTVGTGTDAAGNVVTSTPTNNTFTVDNTPPTSSAGYTVSVLKNGTSQTITLTFSESLVVTPKITVNGPAGLVINNQAMSGSGTVWTYTGTTWTGDGTETVTVGIGTDAAGNVVVSTPTNNTFTVDNTAPTSTAAYTASFIKNGTAQTITVTFNEALTVTPKITVVAPSGTVVNNLSMSGGPTVWTYAAGTTWTGNGTATVTVGTGTDAAGNVVASAPSSNTFTVDNNKPTAAITYDDADGYVSSGQTLRITATFNEPIADAPVMQIALSSPASVAFTNMTKTDATHYYYDYLVGAGNGTVTVTLGTGTDQAGNTITTAPSSGATFIIDNTAPAAPAAYTAVTTVGTVVANYWNGTNTGGTNAGVNLVVTIPNDNSLLNSTLDVEARISSGSFASITTFTSSTISAISTTKTITIDDSQILAITGYAENVQLQFRVRFHDLAGNIGSYTQSTNSLTVDTTPPSITSAVFNASFNNATDTDFTTCSGTAVSNTTAREYVHLVISEPLSLANGTVPTLQTTSSGTIGFNAANYNGLWGGSNYQTFSGCSNRGGCAYHVNGTNYIIHLEDVFLSTGPNVDGLWTTSTTFTFASGGTNIKDLAGNEMASVVTITPGATAPLIASSMVLNPNGSGNEIITFTVDQALNTPTTAGAVTGITVDADGPGPGAAVSVAGTYSTTGNTISLTSSADNQWSSVTTVSYSVAGNLAGATGVKMAAFTSEPILLGPVTIASNNSLSTALAKQGETITITFTANSTLAAAPTATIGGLAATISGSQPNYTASVVTDGTVPQGVVAFTITATESGRSTDVPYTTDGSTVTYDNIAPTTPTAPDLASGSDSNINTDNVTNISTNLVFQGANGTVENNAQVQIFDNTTLLGTATATGTGSWTYTHTGTLIDGVHPINIKARDAAGNLSSASTSLNVTVDTTPPVVASIAYSSTLKGIGITNGIIACPTCTNTSVDFLVTFTETNLPLSGIDATDFFVSNVGVTNTSPFVVAGSGATRTVTVPGISSYGTISLGLTDNNSIIDLAGNPLAGASDGSVATNTTAGSAQYYTIVLPQPGTSAFTASASNITQNSIQINWNSPLSDNPTPTHFLVMAKPTTGGSYPTVQDGTYVADAAPLIKNVARSGINNNYTFTGLNSGTSYDFIVYKYTLATNNTTDNIDFELTTAQSVTNQVTNTASVSWATLNSTTVSVSSLSTSSGASTGVMQFRIYDDGQDPISPNIMNLHLNDVSQETVTFTLTELLTGVSSGASLTGFSSSPGSVASAIYTVNAGVGTITLTNTADGTWSSGTTISYSATTGNAVFATLGKMQSIAAHAVVLNSDAPVVTLTTASVGPWVVPAGVTSIQVETWGAGGSGGEYSTTYGVSSSSGGGGGAYSRSLLSVTPGASYNFTVGAGGAAVPPQACCHLGNDGGNTAFFGPTTVLAEGGKGGLSSAWHNVYGPVNNYGAAKISGGKAINGIGDFKFNGGDGGFGQGATSPSSGGSGGSSAGPTSDGTTGTTAAFCSPAPCSVSLPVTIAPSGGGNGGTASNNVNGGPGGLYGGGGGGVGDATLTSGAGAEGKIEITYSNSSVGGTSAWAGDNSPFKFSGLVITQGPNNSAALGNWQNVIAGVELSDGTNTFSSITNPSDVVINPTNITFTNLPSTTSSDIGFIPDATSTASYKTYTLKVWLKNNMPAAEAASADGSNLDFKFDGLSNLSYDDATNNAQKSSRFAVPQPIISSGGNPIDVVATELDFTTSPIDPQLVLTNVTSVSSAPDNSTTPVIRARDLNGNTDKDYSATIAISASMATSPTSVTMTNGVAVFPPFQYQDSGDGTLTATTSTAAANSLIPAPGTTVPTTPTVNYGATSTITLGSGVATLIPTQVGNAFTFRINDDGGSGGDGSPTRISQIQITPGTGDAGISYTQAFSLVQLEDVATGTSVTGTINSNNLVFAVPFAATTDLGYIGDNGFKQYRLKVTFNTTLGGSLPTTIDGSGQRFVFEVLEGNIQYNHFSSKITSGQNANSGSANGKVNVIATQLKFTVFPGTDYLANKNISVQYPVPVVQALDANGNLDLDYSPSSGITVTNAGGLSTINPPTSFTSGILTFPSNFQYTTITATAGNGVLTVSSSTIPLGGTSAPGSGNSSTVVTTVRNGVAGTITAGPLTEPATISSLIDDGNSVTNPVSGGIDVFDFTVNDDPGGTLATEDDGTPTRISKIVITAGTGVGANTIADWSQVIGYAQLSDGTGNSGFGTIGTNSITFGGGTGIANTLTTDPGYIGDGGSKTYTLRIWLKKTMPLAYSTTIDGLKFNFEILDTGLTLDINSTKIKPGENENSDASGSNNTVQVLATEIDYTTIPVSASINVSFTVVAEARDANGNRDLGYNGAITTFANTASYTTANNPAGPFSAGVLNFPVDNPGTTGVDEGFQFTSGTSSTQLQLAGAASGGAGAIATANGTSPSISVLSSTDSYVYFDPSFTAKTFNNLANQQASSLPDPATAGVETLAQLILSDGGAQNYYLTGIPSTISDTDGAYSQISGVTFSVTGTGVSDLRTVALYDNAGNKISTDVAGGATVTFTGLTLLKALDNNSFTFTIRGTFKSSIPLDDATVQFKITSITSPGGSIFFTNGGVGGPFVGGVNGGSTSPSNTINIVASQFDFVQQPPPYSGENIAVPQPSDGIPPIKVLAHDALGNLDTDFNYASDNNLYGISITTGGAGITGTANFVSGVLDLPNLQYTSFGNGTLTVATTGAPTATSPYNAYYPINSTTGPGTKSTNVEVIHVTAAATSINSGVVTSSNIKGGTSGVVIFGVTFQAQNPDATNGEPKLQKFSFSFDKPYRVSASAATFTLLDVYESTTGIYDPNKNLKNVVGVTVTETQSAAYLSTAKYDMVTVDFGSSPRNLSGTTSYSYFLVVNVDPAANNATPPLTPSLTDTNYLGTAPDNIVVSKGSSYASVIGQQYKFASTQPPILAESYPVNGQLNVAIDQPTIDLYFSVPVWTLDNVVQLRYKSNNQIVATLQALNGQYSNGPSALTGGVNATPKTPLQFSIPANTLIANTQYYITIAPGTLDPITNQGAGIADQNLNFYGGIAASTTLYFKTANLTPINMVGTNPNTVMSGSTVVNTYYATQNGASINGAFDQRGTAFYMVVPTTNVGPTTNAEIKGTATYLGGPVTVRGSFPITQVTLPGSLTTNYNYGSFSAALTPGQTYNVYMCADNDALNTPIPSDGPFYPSGSTFAANTTLVPQAPTLTIQVAPASSGTIYLNTPQFQICANSYTTLSDPIVIEEGAAGDFYNGTGGNVAKDFNLILPQGYTFDVNTVPVISLYGGDFDQVTLPSNPGQLKYKFINSTLLNVSFVNNNNATIDRIIVSNLRVFASSSAGRGTIDRLGGNGITSISDFTNLAILGISASPQLTFTNSFTQANTNLFANAGYASTKAVTSIPDDYVEASLQNSNSVRLVANVPTGDYGPSLFNGTGVSDDIITLTGIQTGAPFNITMTHTDMNGCVVQVTDQYTIYNHLTAIPGLATQQDLTNPNFPNSPSTMNVLTDRLKFNGLAGYYLESAITNIPFYVVNGSQIVNPDPTNIARWDTVVNRTTWAASKIALQGTSHDPGTGNPNQNYPLYYDYSIDFNPILNHLTSAGKNVYYGDSLLGSGFIYTDVTTGSTGLGGATTPAKKYWKGGSLGVIEFVALYQSLADGSLQVPIKQATELFVPAVPAIEIDGWSATKADTLVFCQKGADIILKGFPAGGTSSTASYKLYDAVTNAAIYDASLNIKPAGFSDNGNSNGTAILKAGSITNGYKVIKVVYTYAQNNQPSVGTGVVYIQITPNPVAAFTQTSAIGPNTPTTGSYCVANQITFDGSATAASLPTGFTVGSYNWDFGDASAPASGANANTAVGVTTVHTYSLSLTYTVSLQATSNYGCPSSNAIGSAPGPLTIPVAVGNIPNPDFRFLGNCLRDSITFSDTSTMPAGNANSNITNWAWDFGQGTGTSSLQNPIKIYSGIPSGPVTVTLVATTTINGTNPGCSNTATHTIMLLDTSIVTTTSAYSRDFALSDGGWKAVTLNQINPVSTWGWSDPSLKGSTDLTALNATKMWMTGTNTSYATNEQSALYSGCLNLTGLDRPMISFDAYSNLQSGDGVVLQYSTDSLNVVDPLKKWTVLGKNAAADGIAWYNAQSLATQPGGNKAGYGWSETGNGTIDTLTYLPSKHALDIIYKNGIGPKRLVFRFALASGHTTDSNYEGFAVDNVRIGSRTRTILLESFTSVDGGSSSLNSTLATEADWIYNFIKNTPGTQLVKINYHVGFGGQDPFNLDDPADQGARTLYYGVKAIPYSFMDGERPAFAQSDLLSKWGQQAYDLQSLKLARAIIAINPSIDNTTGRIKIAGKAAAVDASIKPGSVLHVAVLEPKVDVSSWPSGTIQTNEKMIYNTLKVMLPSALGTRFSKALPKDSVINIGPFEWLPSNLRDRANSDSVYVVVFLQDEMSKEVYQAEIVKVQVPPVVTGVEPTAENIKLYPNPADQQLTIELPSPVKESTTLRLANQWGVYTEMSSFSEGEQKKTISTSGLSDGVYILQIGGNDSAVRTKVVILHR